MVKVVETFMRLKNLGNDWRLRRMNYRRLSKKLKLRWNRKKTRCCEHNWNYPRCDRKSTGVFKKRKKNSKIRVRIINAPLIPCKLASLEAEAKGKAEALRMKKKLEADINELEIALDHANKVRIIYNNVDIKYD